MTPRLAVLFVCSQLLLLVAAGNVSRRNDDNSIGKDTKSDVSSTTPKFEESFDEVDDEIAKVVENSKIIVDDRKTDPHQWRGFGSLWPNVPLLPVVYASSSSMPDGPCKRQARRYLENFKNETLWAMQMYDASTKYPGGILNGQTRHLGNFDLCYNTKANLPRYDADEPTPDEEIIGRYCLVDIQYEKQGLPPVNASEPFDLQFDPRGSLWEAIREKGDFRRVRRYILQMALCVPEVCTAGDIEAALREPFARVGIEQNVDFKVSVKPHFCQARTDAPKFSLGAKIYCSVLGGLVLLVAFSTWYDSSPKEHRENHGSSANDLLLCFSARRNYNSLMERTTSYRGLQTIFFMRFFYMSLVILGHRTMEWYIVPTVNARYTEELTTTKLGMGILAGQVVVDAFFGMSGLLASYGLLEQFDKTKKLDFLAAILIRFFRLTPVYAFVLFFNMLILPLLGSGPYWEWKVGLERDSCSGNWWTNFLYVNNYVNPEKICMFQTWHLSVDFQLFILGLLVTYAFWHMPRKLGYSFLCAIIIGGCIPLFVNTYWYDVQPLFKGLLTYTEVREVEYFTEHYVKTHERISAYFVGVLAGAVMYDHKKNPWQISKVASHISLILFGVVFCLGPVLNSDQFYDPNRNPKGLITALHACLNRPVFAVSCIALILLPTVGRGMEFLYNMLTPGWAQPLSRLSYAAFLVHTTHQLYTMGVSRAPKQFEIGQLLWHYLPDNVYSFFLGFLLCLLVEGPFRKIEKRFFSKRRITDSSNETVTKKTN